MFGSCQTGCLQYSMTNSDSTAKTFNCQKNVKSDCSCFVYISQILEIHPTGGWRFCLWASICLRVSFYALINFRLAEVPHQLLCGCAALLLLISCLPICLDSINTHTHAHPHKEQHSTHSQPQRTKSPNTFLLGITHILQRAGPFPPFSCLPWPPAHSLYVRFLLLPLDPRHAPSINPMGQPSCQPLSPQPNGFSDLPRCGPSFVYVYLLIQFGYIVCLQSQTCCSSSSASFSSGAASSSTWNMEIKFTAIK